MASSASTVLKLELMTDGEKSNQWGQITNNNLQMLEGAVTGYVSLTLSGTSSTISITDYTLGEFHNAVFRLGGSPSGAYTLTVPTAEKVYVFDNACGQAVTVKTAAGTGVTISNGKKAMVYCDGTNVVEFINAAVTETSTSTLTNKTLTAPVMTTPTLGVATATSINKIAISTPASGATLTLADGSTLATSGAFSTTLTATATTNVTLPTTGTLVNTAVTTLSSLVSIGTITTGTWNATVIAGQYGGTGVANTGKTITLGGNLTTSGAFNTTLTATATTAVTLPTTGTLATLAGSETLTNKTLTTPVITVNDTQFTLQDNADTTKKVVFELSNITTATTRTIQFPNSSGTLALEGAGGSSSTTVVGVLTAGTWNADIITGQYGGTGVANTGKTITLGGNLTTSGAFNTTLTVTGTTGVTLPTSGTLSTLAGSEALTNKTVNGMTVTSTTGTLTLASGSTLATSGANSLTLTTTGSTNVTLPTTGTLATLAGTETLTNKTFTNPTLTVSDSLFTLQDNLDNTKKVVFQLSGITTGTTRTFTFPDASTTFATLTGTETFTNKTLTAPIISTISNTGNLTLPTSTDTLVGRATTDTLTNKTLTAPVISTISNSGTITLPTGTRTLVARDTTDTLTNKTLTAPVLSGTVSGTYTLSAPTVLTPAINDAALSGTMTGTFTLGGTATATYSNVVSTYTGHITLGSRVIRQATTGNAITITNAAGSGTTLTLDDSGNLTTAGTITATGTITASGTITGGNLTTAGTMTAGAAIISSTSPTMTFSDTDWGARYVHANGGLIGFLTSGSAWASYTDNSGNFVAAANVSAYSDARLKTNVHTIGGAVDLVGRMRGVHYNRIDTGNKRVGVIAQEMQAVLPEVVMEGADGTLAVSYGDLVGVLIQAVNELSARVRELEAR